MIGDIHGLKRYKYLDGWVTSMAPRPMNLYGLVTFMAPCPYKSKWMGGNPTADSSRKLDLWLAALATMPLYRWAEHGLRPNSLLYVTQQRFRTRNRPSGPDVGRTAMGKEPKSAQAGRRAYFGAFPVAVRPKPGPEGRFLARKHYCYIAQSILLGF